MSFSYSQEGIRAVLLKMTPYVALYFRNVTDACSQLCAVCQRHLCFSSTGIVCMCIDGFVIAFIQVHYIIADEVQRISDLIACFISAVFSVIEDAPDETLKPNLTFRCSPVHLTVLFVVL